MNKNVIKALFISIIFISIITIISLWMCTLTMHIELLWLSSMIKFIIVWISIVIDMIIGYVFLIYWWSEVEWNNIKRAFRRKK